MQEIDVFACNDAETCGDEDERDKALSTFSYIDAQRVVTVPAPSHHLIHAYGAFYAAGYQDAAVLVVDVYGSPVRPDCREQQSGFSFSRAREPQLLFRAEIEPTIALPRESGFSVMSSENASPGVGEVYHLVTLILGFTATGADGSLSQFDEAGKTMALAAYGPRLSDSAQMIRVTDDGIDTSNALTFLRGLNLLSRNGNRETLAIRDPSTPLSRFHQRLAAQLQWEFEMACLHLAGRLRRMTNHSNLVLSGGCFLNSCANNRIRREAGFDSVFIMPPASDDGNAIGCAYYAYLEATGCSKEAAPPAPIRQFYLGRRYTATHVRNEIARLGLTYSEFETPAEVADNVAALLAQNSIVGWFQGASEFGPRALGNRSILANPMLFDIKDRLNRSVKFREPFRPFAPATLREVADVYFELDGVESPYMLLVCDVVEKFRRQLPGILHEDGTARVQTVDSHMNPLFYRLIHSFGEHSSFPIVLNTSYNARGMPIVETPADALALLFATDLEAVGIERFVVSRPDVEALIPVLRGSETVVRSRLDAAGELAPESVRAANGRSYSGDILEVLSAVNGRRTVREVFGSLGLDDGGRTLALQLYRDGLIGWLQVPWLRFSAKRP